MTMSPTSWINRLFLGALPSSAMVSRKRRAFSPIKLEFLEDRTAPAGGITSTGLEAAQPQITSVSLNGEPSAAALTGPQHSRIVDVQLAFDQPVQLDAGALSLSLHTNNVRYDGVSQPSGMGAIPTLVVAH